MVTGTLNFQYLSMLRRGSKEADVIFCRSIWDPKKRAYKQSTSSPPHAYSIELELGLDSQMGSRPHPGVRLPGALEISDVIRDQGRYQWRRDIYAGAVLSDRLCRTFLRFVRNDFV